LHFNIVDGWQASRSCSLTDRQGRYRASHSQRGLALLGWLNERDLKHEFRNQASILREKGVTITHVDSHGHLHKWPSVARATRSLLGEFSVDAMRRPQDLYFKRNPFDFFDLLCSYNFPKVRTTDHYCAIHDQVPDWIERLPGILKSASSGSIELSVHPGRAEHWRRQEFEPLYDVGRPYFEKMGIELISFNDL
jgi:predicted glycoside hydrolase/deacetylase ChbG (UPF0249 family)